MGVRPRVLGDRALLKPLEANEVTGGGVVLPSEVRLRETRGIVVAVGDPGPVQPGDVVVFAEAGSSPYAHPTWVTVDNDETGHAEEFVVVDYMDLLLILEEVAAGIEA